MPGPGTWELILARLVLKEVLAGINSKWGTEVLGFGDSGDTYACYSSQEKMPRKQEQSSGSCSCYYWPRNT